MWMHLADLSVFSFPGMKVPKKHESRSQHLYCLEKIILSMHLLETDNIVVLDGPPEIVEFLLSVLLRGKTDLTRPGVPSSTPQTSIREMATCIPTCTTLQYLRWLKSSLLATGTCGSWESLVVVQLWDHQGRRAVWIDRILQSDPLANPGTWTTPVSMWWL